MARALQKHTHFLRTFTNSPSRTTTAHHSYVESVAFTALVTTPLSLFLRNTGLQLLAGPLEADLHILRTYLRDVRHARAAALGDATYLALLAQSPHDNNDNGQDAGPDASAYIQQATLSPVGESSTTSLPPASPQTPQERQWWAVNGQGSGGRNNLRRGGGDREMI